MVACGASLSRRRCQLFKPAECVAETTRLTFGVQVVVAKETMRRCQLLRRSRGRMTSLTDIGGHDLVSQITSSPQQVVVSSCLEERSTRHRGACLGVAEGHDVVRRVGWCLTCGASVSSIRCQLWRSSRGRTTGRRSGRR